MGIETNGLSKTHKDTEKFLLPLGDQFYTKNLPLKVIYILSAHKEPMIEFMDISNSAKGFTHIQQAKIGFPTGIHLQLDTLKDITLDYHYLKGLGKNKQHLKHTVDIASKINIVRIFHPETGFDLNELMNLIQEDLMKRGVSTGTVKPFKRQVALENA